MAFNTLVSPQKKAGKHPLASLKACLDSCSKEEKAEFDFFEWREDTVAFLTMMCNSGPCYDLENPRRMTDCACMEELNLADEEVEKVVDYLVQFFLMSWSEQRMLILEWKRYAESFRQVIEHDPSSRGQVTDKKVYR